MNSLQLIQSGAELQQMTLNTDYYTRFIDYLDVAPKTIETYSKALKQLFNYFAINGITQPQRSDILAFKEELKESGKKPSTIQSYITATRLFFSWTAQENLYPNIAEKIKGAKLDKGHKKDYLTSRQVKTILSSIEQDTLKGLRDYAILSLMVTGGLRDIEVERANIGDIRNAGEETVLYIQGKGREEKNEYIKISLPVENAIRKYLKERGQSDESKPLFASISNNSDGAGLTTRSISRIVKSRMKAAGFDSERLTAHSLRHTAVTLSLLAGKDITEVQQFARHSNIATTMIYNHSLDKAKNSCGAAVSDAIFQ